MQSNKQNIIYTSSSAGKHSRKSGHSEKLPLASKIQTNKWNWSVCLYCPNISTYLPILLMHLFKYTRWQKRCMSVCSVKRSFSSWSLVWPCWYYNFVNKVEFIKQSCVGFIILPVRCILCYMRLYQTLHACTSVQTCLIEFMSPTSKYSCVYP